MAWQPRQDLGLIFRAMGQRGYKLFESEERPYNLNIVGIRTEAPAVDEFRCWMLVFWLKKTVWQQRSWQITTLPGRYYLIDRLLNRSGCAILVPGQYEGAYQIGKHRNDYEALIQTGPVRVFRDDDRDDSFDLVPLTEELGFFGINIHRAAKTGSVPKVGKYSAGCQVFRSAEDFEEFMELCELSEMSWGNSFTYTLIEEREL